jgi:subtilisin family serine protease
MRTQKMFSRLSRLFAILVVLGMVFAQFASAAAQEPLPLETVDVGEVQDYYSRKGVTSGMVGVVVELKDTPAALVYAQRSVSASINQVQTIQQKQATLTSTLQSKGIQFTELYRTQKAYNGIWMYVDVADLKVIAKASGVKAIHPMIPQTIDHTTSVPLIGAPQVWGGLTNYQGDTISVGVIDTGIDYVHTNFNGGGVYTGQDFTTLTEAGNIFPTAKVVGGWDFAGDAYDANPGNPTYNPVPSPDADPMDCNGHGSHVSGSVAGYGVNADGTTYVEAGADTYAALKDLTSAQYMSKFRIGPGVAPKAELYALRVFGCAGSTDLTTKAIEWAMDPNGDTDMSDHLDVINMSLGSSFGSPTDASAAASNNAAEAGVIVVASAGNSGDVFYVTGAPGLASRAISVASNVDASAVFSAFEVTAAPTVTTGLYAATTAIGNFGPASYSVPGDLLQFSGTDLGCLADGTTSPYTATPTYFAGKIALINRGTCSFQRKAYNAQQAGALGVLLVNSSTAFPGNMGADAAVPAVTIPIMMTTLSTGTSIRTDMLAGTVSVLLTSAYPESVILTDAGLVDTVSSFTSRGPARGGTFLKPDIAAPGDTIFSTDTGTGNKGTSLSGTSMAAPHMAGVMALLKQLHPTWTVAELKALVMNTAANDIFSSTAKTIKNSPTRVGAGRVSIPSAVASSVIAFNKDSAERVSVSFGAQQVATATNFTQAITLKNTGVAAETYDLTFDARYGSNPGLVYSIVDGSDNVLASVTVPAGDTAEVTVKIAVDPATLTRTFDPSISTATRFAMSEGGGYVTLTSTGTAPTLRVPVHIAARPASTVSATETAIALPAGAAGTFPVNLTGTGLTVAANNDTAKTTVLELLGTSTQNPLLTGTNAAADLKYIGAGSNYPTTAAFTAGTMYFGIATYGNWETIHQSVNGFDIYVDIDKDGTPEYDIYNCQSGSSSSPTDIIYVCVYDFAAPSVPVGYVNGFHGTTLSNNTNPFHNNVVMYPVQFNKIGLVDGVTTSFNFWVESYTREGDTVLDVSDTMTYDVAAQSFPGTSGIYSLTTLPVTLNINYDKAAIAASNSQGLLLLQHHNTLGNTTQVIPFPTPTAVTNPATAITDATATLNGTVNAADGSIAAKFEYGLTTAYGSTALASENPVIGNTDTAVSAGIIGLLPNTTYHFRVVAGSVNGADATFTTEMGTPVLTFDAAPAASYGSNFTVNAMTTNTDAGATVTYSKVSGACSQVSGGTFAPTGVGECVVQADSAATTNFNAAAPVQQSITIAMGSLTVTASSDTMVYGGTVPTITPDYGGKMAPATLPTCSTTATGNSDVASYPSSCSGADEPKYTISYVDGTVEVTAAPLTVTASDDTMVYGGIVPTIMPEYTGLVAGDTAPATAPSCSTTATDTSDVASYPSSCSGVVDGNYTIGYVAGTVEVTAAPLTITASSDTMVYGGAVPTITPAYAGLAAGDTAPAIAPSCSTTATDTSDVASYPSSCSGAVDGNYTIGYVAGTVEVTAAPLTITASSHTMVYGGTVPTIMPDYTGLVAGDTATATAPTCSTTATSTSDVGDYPSSCSGAVDGNYTIGYVAGTVTVTPATATIDFGTAPAATYPGANFTVTATTNSDGALTYSAVAGSACTTTGGGIFTPTAIGTCTVQADVPATTNYTVATDTLDVEITQGNLPPTNITLSKSTVPENSAIGATVGTLAAIDPNSGDSATFALASGVAGCTGTNNGSFQITGATLKTKFKFDFETKNSYFVCVRVTDSKGATFAKSFNVKVTNVLDNLAKNGDFELYTGTSKIPTGWAAMNFGVLDGKNTTFKTGKFAVKIANTAAKLKTLTQTISIPTGAATQKFFFSYWVKGASVPLAGGVCQGQVLLYNGSSAAPNKIVTLPCGKTGNFAYTLKTTSFTTTLPYTKAVIKFTYSKASGSVFFDVVMLKK